MGGLKHSPLMPTLVQLLESGLTSWSLPGTSLFQIHRVDELLRHLEIAEVHRLVARSRESDPFA